MISSEDFPFADGKMCTTKAYTSAAKQAFWYIKFIQIFISSPISEIFFLAYRLSH